MAINKEGLSRLSPEERIKKLKLMEEERKKEVNEIERLIAESMREMRISRIADEIAPEQKPVDISRLFEGGHEERLERTARESRQAAGTRLYQAVEQLYHDYSQLKQFYGVVATGGNLTNEQLAAIGEIGERVNRAERYMTDSEKTASKLVASRTVLYKLRKETGID